MAVSNRRAERAREIIVSINLISFFFTEAGQMLCFNLLFQLVDISLSCFVLTEYLLKFNTFTEYLYYLNAILTFG